MAPQRAANGLTAQAEFLRDSQHHRIAAAPDYALGCFRGSTGGIVTALGTDTGVILIPPFKELGSATANLSFREWDAKILFFLAYFKNVAVVPFNTSAFSTSTILEQTLVFQQQIVAESPPRWEIDSFDLNFWSEQTKSAFDAINLREEGETWAMSPPGEVAIALSREGGPALTLSFENCLPCPHPDTSPADLLSFRAEFADELSAFRAGLEDLSAAINADSEEQARRVLEHRLREAVQQTQSSWRSSGLRSFLGTLKVGLQIASPALGHVLAGHFGYPGLGETLAVGIAVAADHSALSRAGNAYPKDFEYVLTGLKRGLLAAFPEEPELHFDVRNTTIRSCILQPNYPQTPTPPSGSISQTYQRSIM